MPKDYSIPELGFELEVLVTDQSMWSQETFGKDDILGPVNALRHIAKEAKEAEEAYEDLQECCGGCGTKASREWFHEELADCFLLILDASRRGGMTPYDLILKAQEKMAKNRQRKWNKPNGDTPTEHIREDGE